MTVEDENFLRHGGVVVVFNMKMDPTTLDWMSCGVQWLREFPVEGFRQGAFRHWIELTTTVTPFGIEEKEVVCGRVFNDITVINKEKEEHRDFANAVQLTFPNHSRWLPPGIYRVILDGNMILSRDELLRQDGTKGQLTLDGNHLAPGLTRRCPTGDLIEGGRFESWFMIRPRFYAGETPTDTNLAVLQDQ